MSASIVGFVSRAAAGLVGPRSVSKNITPARGGVAVHYGGPKQPCAEPGADHALCVRTWKNWQKYHMGTHGWADIAYTGGFCQHGYAFAGRGAGVRTAANGTNAGNQSYYAVTWIGGEGQTPSALALASLEWWIHTLRSQGAATRVKAHRFFKPTGCPGDPLVGQAARLDGAHVPLNSVPAPTPAPARPTPAPTGDTPVPPTLREGAKGDDVRRLQALLVAVRHDLKIDGDFGPNTKRNVEAFQRARGLGVDGIVGPNTWRRLILG